MSEKKPYPNIAQGFVVFIIYIAYVIFFAFFSRGNNTPEAKLIVKFLVDAATFFTVYAIQKRTTTTYPFRLSVTPPLVILSGFVAWITMYVLLSIVLYLYPELENTGYLAKDHTSRNIYSLIAVAFVAPIFEELIFRGVVLYGFLKRYKPGVAIFVSALIFAIMHMDPIQSSYALFVGLLLGWVFWKTCSLLLCILLHIFNNFIATYDWGDDMGNGNETLRETLSPVQFSLVYVGALILFSVSIYYINRYYKRRIKTI